MTMRTLWTLTCLLLPVLTWSESFIDLVKEADAATVQATIDAGANLEARDDKYGWKIDSIPYKHQNNVISSKQ